MIVFLPKESVGSSLARRQSTHLLCQLYPECLDFPAFSLQFFFSLCGFSHRLRAGEGCGGVTSNSETIGVVIHGSVAGWCLFSATVGMCKRWPWRSRWRSRHSSLYRGGQGTGPCSPWCSCQTSPRWRGGGELGRRYYYQQGDMQCSELIQKIRGLR